MTTLVTLKDGSTLEVTMTQLFTLHFRYDAVWSTEYARALIALKGGG